MSKILALPAAILVASAMALKPKTIDNLVYPWSKPDWWSDTLYMFYGYKVSGLLYSYTREMDTRIKTASTPNGIPLYTETTYYTDVLVDSKSNRTKTTLWKDKERKKKSKEVAIDYNNARIMTVEELDGDGWKKTCQIEQFNSTVLSMMEVMQKLWTPGTTRNQIGSTVYRGPQCLVVDDQEMIPEGKSESRTPRKERKGRGKGERKMNANVISFTNTDAEGIAWQTFFTANGGQLVYAYSAMRSDSFDYTLQFWADRNSHEPVYNFKDSDFIPALCEHDSKRTEIIPQDLLPSATFGFIMM